MSEISVSHGVAQVAPPPQRRRGASHRILVVDDDRAIREFSAEVLMLSGYAVHAAGDGAAAWQALDTNCYDLLITDNDMPKMSGVELLKKLRVARMTLPVILVSGMMPTEELDRHPWLDIGATLSKPYTIPELLGTVRSILRKPDDGCGESAARSASTRST